MTVYPDRQEIRFAAKIKDMDRRLKVAETQLNNAKTTIANHVAIITDLLTRIGDPANTGTAGVTKAQFTFLAGLSQMTTPTTFPLPADSGSGSYWITGERDFVNSSINLDNDLIDKLQRNGFMSTST